MNLKKIIFELNNKSITAIILFAIQLLTSCHKNDNKLEQALMSARDNRGELEKVLEHYSKNPKDSLKYRSACFLIENMPYHYSFDTTYLQNYRPVIKTLEFLKANGFSEEKIKDKVNPFMDSLISVYPLSNIYSKTKDDITSIKSEFLIANINHTINFYNSNPFKDSIAFIDFLEFVLPYRIEDGYCLEEWRRYFSTNYSQKINQNFSSFHELCDSLLYIFSDIEIGWRIAHQFPYLKLDDYLKSKTAHCTEKCWLNSMLLRSFGIPTTVDFIPTSRIHELGHEWNAIKLKHGTFPFEPFWEDNIWCIGEYYTRKKDDPLFGSFQPPKIYRKTFSPNYSELLLHSINSGEEIPMFFRNLFRKDVTKEYFNTFKLEIPIIIKDKKLSYAYACVMGKNKWVAIDFGKVVRHGKVIFNSLGSKNVYLPSLYKNNNLIPAAYPVLLKENGETLILRPDTSVIETIEVSYVAYPRPQLNEYKDGLIGTVVEVANDKNFNNSKILYSINRICEPGTHRVPIQTESKYRYIRLIIPKTKLKLNEITFFSRNNGVLNEVKGELISSLPKDNSYLERLADGDLLTSFTPRQLCKEHLLLDSIWIGFDFQHPIKIDAFEFYFAFNANIRKKGVYELLYWDFGWKSLGIKKSNSTSPISFDNVPKNALLKIKIHDTNSNSRIFTYENGKQFWW